MAAECTETSVINNPNPSSSTQSWWQEIMHANSLCSWSNNNSNNNNGSFLASSNFPWLQNSISNHSSESSGEDDVSISNQSVLTAESSRQLVDGAGALAVGELIGETTSDQNHLWSHLLLSGGSTRGGMEYKSNHHHPQQVGDSMLNLSSPSTTTTTTNYFDNINIMSNNNSDDYNYLKKMGNTYEFNLTNHDYGVGHENLRPAVLTAATGNHQPPPIFAAGHPCGQLHDVSCICTNNNNINSGGIFNNPSRNLNDFSANFQSYLNKPLLDINHEYKPPALKSFQYLSSSGGYVTKKRGGAGLQTSPVQSSRVSTSSTITRSNGRGHGNLGSEGKKKKLIEVDNHNSEKGILKKPKNDNSSAPKIQVPKVKVADKITALQQIVSPFGKTDTASVLWEAIGHIRFLQEKIQLLTDAYAKSNTRKEIPWGGLIVESKKDGGDLKSRGLCLVPTSYTPQIYRESNASDYLIPTYRDCLYG